MPQRWHWLRLRTTCHPTEDPERVRQAISNCMALEQDAAAGVLDELKLESHHGGEVIVFEAALTRAAEIRGALALIPEDERQELAKEADARIDENGVFHCRISKQRAFEGTIGITKGDDAIQLRLKPEVHPASREAAVAAIVSWFEGSN